MIVIWNGLYFTMQYCREANAGRNLTVLIVLISMIYCTIIVHLLNINPKLGGICYSSKPTATHVIWQSCLRSLRGLATCSKIWLLYLGERGDKGDCVTFFSALQSRKQEIRTGINYIFIYFSHVLNIKSVPVISFPLSPPPLCKSIFYKILTLLYMVHLAESSYT